MSSLQGKTVLVTGGTRGIGFSIAKALLGQGARVAITGRSQEGLDRAVSQLGRDAQGLVADLSIPGAADQLAQTAQTALGRVDILVNNAGGLHVGTLEQTRTDDFRAMLELNLTAPFALIRALVPSMVQRREGRVINISSISGTLGTPRLSAYCASKWGLNGLTRALAEELKGTGVLMAAVLPGSVDTQMLKEAGFTPAMQPSAVAEVVRFLCSDAPVAMQGSLVEVFG